MGTGYTRNDTSNNIADGNIINASDLDGEFDAVEAAFNSSTGHTHDGTSAEGASITVVGPVQDLVVSTTEVKPKTTNTLDIGTGSLQFKDLHLDGTAYLDDVQAVGAVDITGDLDVDNINIDGNTIISTDTNGDINISPDGTGTVVIDTDLDVDNININGNTIISTDTNGNIALTPNGTGEVDISKVDIDSGAIDGTVIGASSAAAITGTTITGTSFVTSGDMTFGDNDKAIFGAGSDLQIYHDASDSIINDNGTGSLKLQTGGSTKLEVTSSGIDVTGTVLGNALAVGDDEPISLRSNLDSFDDIIRDTTGNATIIRARNDVRVNLDSNNDSTTAAAFVVGYDGIDTTTTKALEVKEGGDISFYDSTGVTQGLFWDASTQRLGLGTTGPATPLDVRAASPFIRSTYDSTGTYVQMFHNGSNGYFDFSSGGLIWRGAGQAESMRLDASGNLLVSKTSANSTTDGIELRGGSGAVRFIGKTDSNAVGYLNRGVSDGDILQFAKDNTTVGSIGAWSSSLLIGTGDVGLAFVDGTPERIQPRKADDQTSADGLIDLGHTSNRFKDLYLSGTANAGGLTVDTNTLYVDSTNDRVGIRTSSPQTALVISNGGAEGVEIDGYNVSAAAALIQAYNRSTSAFIPLELRGSQLEFNIVGSEAARIDSSGNLLVGTTSNPMPFQQGRLTLDTGSGSYNGLAVSQLGTGFTAYSTRPSAAHQYYAGYFLDSSGTAIGSISVSTTATAYNTSSDYRLKENVTADWDATTRLKQLNPVRFNFIADADTTVDGFLAHEVQDIVPEAITGTHNEVDDDGNPVYQGIDQSKLVPLLVKTIQELEARIAALEAN